MGVHWMSGGRSGRRPRVARSAMQWRELFGAFEASGLSKSAFCRERDVALSSFNRALRELRCDGASASSQPLTASPFVAVTAPQVTEAPSPSFELELQLSAETVLRLRMGRC